MNRLPLKKFFIPGYAAGSDSVVTPDLLVQILLLLLGLWGCMAVYTATSFSPEPFYFAGRQLLWLTLGLAVMFFASCLPFDFYLNNAWPLAVIAYIPLVAVLFIGKEVNGMRGWFELGNSMIQPAEFGKIFFILLLCSIAGQPRETGFKTFAYLLSITLFWILPVLLEPDFGTGIVYAAGFLFVYWLAGGKLRHILLLPLIAAPFIFYFIRTNRYILKRFSGYWNPAGDPFGSGWHIRQFQFTIARGGLFGTGSEQAYWTNSYLPLPHSDSVFASISECLGFVGAAPLPLLMLIILLIICVMAFRVTNDNSRKLFIISTGMLFAFQFMLHISVNVTLLPPTGVTLPILSYGGSSMLATMLAFGMLLSAASERDRLM